MGRIPEETIQQVLAATDIVDLIGRTVKLRKNGANYVGLCPFHTERTPSFNVYPHNHSYYCFGCQASGTAARFLMEHEGLPFVEAIRRLAEAAGIRIEEEVWDAETEREAKRRGALKLLMEDITSWYHNLLLRHEMAAEAREYLKSRGITSAVAKSWQLGYAPAQDMWVRRWAAGKGYSEQLLSDAGIYKRTDDGRSYSFFRHRMMIPIRNENGECIAFSGRLLSADAKEQKYKNSPETMLFSKSRVLFGFDKSRKFISKTARAVVCEGQLDTVAVFEAGIQNVVGTQGTAFTEHHAKMLRRQCSEVVLCFDSDNAGFNAAEKSFKVLSPAGLVVKVARLPKGDDPDSFIKKHGGAAFQTVLDQAVDFLDFQIAHKRSTQGSDLRSQVMLAEQTAVTISLNPSVSARDFMIRAHAAQLGLSEDALRSQVNTFVRRQLRSAADGKATPTAPSALTPAQEAARFLEAQHKTALLLAQQALVDETVMEWLRRQDLDSILHDLPGTELLGCVWQAHYDPADVHARSAFIAALPPMEESAITQLIRRALPKSDIKSAMKDLEALGTARLLHLIQRTQAEMKRPEFPPDQVADLHHQVIAWRKEYLDRLRAAQDTA
jgi:DNA primase